LYQFRTTADVGWEPRRIRVSNIQILLLLSANIDFKSWCMASFDFTYSLEGYHLLICAQFVSWFALNVTMRLQLAGVQPGRLSSSILVISVCIGDS
jgi:hypothetical protein